MSRETQLAEFKIPNKHYLLHFRIIQGGTSGHGEILSTKYSHTRDTDDSTFANVQTISRPVTRHLKSPGHTGLNQLQQQPGSDQYRQCWLYALRSTDWLNSGQLFISYQLGFTSFLSPEYSEEKDWGIYRVESQLLRMGAA